ncbi:XopAK family type III secretion system effector [Burkholderia gladioli]|uniref:XopAK family type III secretion system effector n=1 Tax=Burkholderia gladioli TaxID=28095 RepID=UPI001641F5B7|nr:XopAK family type III secretion system effector [Burkholderia gladioli]
MALGAPTRGCADVVGTKAADGRFDVKDPKSGATIGRLAIVDSTQADGTPGERVGVDLDHAKLPGGMWHNGYASHYGHYGQNHQYSGAGSSTGPGTAAYSAPPAAPVVRPWSIGNTQLAAHIPSLATRNISPLDSNQLAIAMNPGQRLITGYTATSTGPGVTVHRFQIQMNPGTVPLGVRASVRNGVLEEIKLSPSNKKFQFVDVPTQSPAPSMHMNASTAGFAAATTAPVQTPPYDSRRRIMPPSARHRPLNNRDVYPYRQLEHRYANLFQSGRIRRAPESQNYLFQHVVDVGMDEPRVIRQSEGSTIGTDGLGPCIAICARGIDASGQAVLGIYHYSGAIETPTEAMRTLDDMMREKGAVQTHYSLIGGMITPEEHQSGSYQSEREFLSLTGSYNIEGVRLHVSEGEHDSQGVENSVGVVLSNRSAVYRSGALYPYSN